MEIVGSLILGIGSMALAILWYHSLFETVAFGILYISVCILGMFVGLKWFLMRGQSYHAALPTQKQSLVSMLVQKMMTKKAACQINPKKIVTTRNLDLAIQELMDLIINDFVISWYKDFGKDNQLIASLIKADIWFMVDTFTTCFSKVDMVKFITQDLVNILHNHFKEIRMASKKSKEATSLYKYTVYPWLESDEKEVEFLRLLTEAVMSIILPKSHAQCDIVRHLLREVITVSVFKPSIDMLCDPEYLNDKLLAYLDYRAKLCEDTRKSYTYAATYEDFVKMIQTCDDTEYLKHIRYNIITEIMQATTINNWKKSQGISTDKASAPKSMSKGDLLKARNLKTYINQLTVAKSTCEKRIHALGGPDYKYYSEEQAKEETKSSHPGQKVLSFKAIMDVPAAKLFFLKFLKRNNNHSLLEFWNCVEDLKQVSKSQHHEKAHEIFEQYINGTSSAVHVERSTLKGMESFMLGDAGPDAFYEAQNHVYLILEEQHYPTFIVSDIYHEYILALESEPLKKSPSVEEDFLEGKETLGAFEVVEDVLFADQSYSIQKRLEKLDEKILNKTQALTTLKNSTKIDVKLKKVQEDLEKEVENLQMERRQLGAYVERTELWWENQGKWKAHVSNAEIVSDGDKVTPYFVIVVHVAAVKNPESLGCTQGWVISRTLTDFAALHEKLIQIGPWLKKKELPNTTLMWFKAIDSTFLEKAKETLENYLTTVMKDDRMAQSEALFAFLSPAPDFLSQQSQGRRNWNFSLVKLFRGLPVGNTDNESDDELLFANCEGGKEEQSRDSIAEPLYHLINEVFELRGLFKWLRKSFILFVEVTFGRSINRQLRVTIDWIFSESMLIYYIQTFQESMWPNGVLAEPSLPKTEEEKMKSRIEAKEKLLQNLPDAVKTLVGEDNARQGAIKMFEVLQDCRLNKQLFYGTIEVILQEICPELNIKFPSKQSSSLTTGIA